MYSSALIIFIEALTPVHAGTGREEGFHVDLPLQRDELGFPTIWSSSLKGALKANLDTDIKRYLGSEPGARETEPSYISILDAKLLLIPARTLTNIWTYISSPHLLSYLKTYLDIYSSIMGRDLTLNLDILNQNTTISTKFSGNAFINETEFSVVGNNDLLTRIGIDKLLPKELKESIARQGLVVIPDEGNRSLATVRKSIVIQYRVRLKREEKTVDEGPWSEEYLPARTVMVSLALCRDARNVNASELCNMFKNILNNRSVYVGGKETIGRGLVKLYVLAP